MVPHYIIINKLLCGAQFTYSIHERVSWRWCQYRLEPLTQDCVRPTHYLSQVDRNPSPSSSLPHSSYGGCLVKLGILQLCSPLHIVVPWRTRNVQFVGRILRKLVAKSWEFLLQLFELYTLWQYIQFKYIYLRNN